MNTVTADDVLEKSLGVLDCLTEIRDSQGKVIGYFSPVAYRTVSVYPQAAANFDVDELKRRKASKEKGFTTVEVMDYLKSLQRTCDTQ